MTDKITLTGKCLAGYQDKYGYRHYDTATISVDRKDVEKALGYNQVPIKCDETETKGTGYAKPKYCECKGVDAMCIMDNVTPPTCGTCMKLIKVPEAEQTDWKGEKLKKFEKQLDHDNEIYNKLRQTEPKVCPIDGVNLTDKPEPKEGVMEVRTCPKCGTEMLGEKVKFTVDTSEPKPKEYCERKDVIDKPKEIEELSKGFIEELDKRHEFGLALVANKLNEVLKGLKRQGIL